MELGRNTFLHVTPWLVHHIKQSPDWLLLLYMCRLQCDWLQGRSYVWCARNHLMIMSQLQEGSLEELITCNHLSTKALKPLRIHSFTKHLHNSYSNILQPVTLLYSIILVEKASCQPLGYFDWTIWHLVLTTNL